MDVPTICRRQRVYSCGKFPGGETLTFSVANDGVGIPAVNPNLSEDTIKTVNDVYAKVKIGEITVMDSNDGSLIK